MKHLRNLFLTGLIVILPIAATISIVGWLFNKIDSIFREPLERLIGFPLVGIGVFLTLLIIFSAGIISTNYLGKKLINLAEGVLKKIPLVNTVYLSIKQLMDTVLSNKKATFKSAVLVQYPSKDIYAIGFITADAPDELCIRTSKKLKSIFIPTTPNPTSGMLVMIPEEEIIPLDIPVEAAVKLVVSAGMLLPENIQKDITKS
ncbi:MAG: DUF502 domain-containing protein [Bacillota bacterium]